MIRVQQFLTLLLPLRQHLRHRRLRLQRAPRRPQPPLDRHLHLHLLCPSSHSPFVSCLNRWTASQYALCRHSSSPLPRPHRPQTDLHHYHQTDHYPPCLTSSLGLVLPILLCITLILLPILSIPPRRLLSILPLITIPILYLFIRLLILTFLSLPLLTTNIPFRLPRPPRIPNKLSPLLRTLTSFFSVSSFSPSLI